MQQDSISRNKQTRICVLLRICTFYIPLPLSFPSAHICYILVLRGEGCVGAQQRCTPVCTGFPVGREDSDLKMPESPAIAGLARDTQEKLSAERNVAEGTVAAGSQELS